MPSTQVLAFDLNPKAQDTCRTLAQKNGVTSRVQVGALFQPQDFARYAGQKVLVLCDIEGAEIWRATDGDGAARTASTSSQGLNGQKCRQANGYQRC